MLEMVGGKLAEWAITKAADLLFDQTGNQVKARLNKNDLQQAIASGIQAAVQHELTLPPQEHLFFHCEEIKIRKFKQAVFSDAAIQEELQRPFCNQGKPRVEFLIAGFKQVANDAEVKLNERALKPWLEKFVDAYFVKTSAIQFRIAKQDYCEQLVNWYDDVKFAGIAVEGQVIDEAKELENIFVMPDAVGEGRRGEDRQFFTVASKSRFLARVAEDIEAQDFPSLTSEISMRQRALIDEQRQQLRQLESQWSGAKVLASELLSQNDSKKLVLLGAPGSGKTTLMSYFAVMVGQGKAEALGLNGETDWLPILIRIRELTINPELSILDYARQFAEKTLSCMPLPGGFFEAWLDDGRALILLDGLDEVAEEGKRQEIVRKIENFLGQFEQNRAIVTSRPAGYRRDFFRTSEYPHYLLQPFDDDKIETFINNWYDSRTPDQQESERRKESLRKALADNARIKQLSRNPLLLTIIALIHRYQAQLPRERYKLYDKAVETLLTTWDANREITSHKALQYLRLDDLRRLMERLAYWIHTQGGTGDNEGGTLIDRDELVTQLSLYIRERKRDLARDEAKAEAQRFLKHIQHRTGLLNEQGQDRYAFVHKTFQEYLAAQEIIYLEDDQDFEDPEDYKPYVLNHLRQHLCDQHWREVLLLLVAQQKPKKATQCLKTIVNFPDPYEQWLHRNLLFAGSCLAEGISVTGESLVARILDGLVALEISDSSLVSRKIRSQVFRTLCSLYETEFAPLALQRLLEAPIEKVGKVRLQQYRAALGDRPGACESLLALLKDEKSDVRSSAAFALGQIGKASDAVVDALLTRLNDKAPDVRSSAASALVKLGKASDAIVGELLALLKDEKSSLRSSAAFALGEIGKASDVVVDALLVLLKDEDLLVGSSAAFALGEIGKTSDTVVYQLLALLKDEDLSVHFNVVATLVKLGKASDVIVDELTALLKDENLLVRYSVAESLGKIGKASDLVVDALLVLLKDENLLMRSSAAFALVKLGKAPDAVVGELIVLLENENSYICSRVAESLGEIGKASDVVVDGLLVLLKDEDLSVRSSAAFALVKLGKASDAVVDALVALLKHEKPFMRSRAASALVKLGRTSEQAGEQISQALVQWLEQNSEAKGASHVVDALWDLVVGENG